MNNWPPAFARMRERLFYRRYGAREERAAPTRRTCVLDYMDGRLRLLQGQESKHKTKQGCLFRRRIRLLRLRQGVRR